jgi:hypothetical protein
LWASKTPNWGTYITTRNPRDRSFLNSPVKKLHTGFLTELHIDRAYLNCHWVKQRSENLTIFCKAWRVRNGNRFDQTAFILDWDNNLIRCPNGVSIPFESGTTARFPKND